MWTAIEYAFRVTNLSTVHPGDDLEARQGNTVIYRGEVEETSPQLGVLWIRYGPLQTRKLLDHTEYELWKWEHRGTVRKTVCEGPA